VSDLALAAADTRHLDACAQLYSALLPYRGHLVVWGGAVGVAGPVSYYLGVLATRLGRLDEAHAHLGEALRLSQDLGALPSVAHCLAALADAATAGGDDPDLRLAEEYRQRARTLARSMGMAVLLTRLGEGTGEWSLRRDGPDWVLEAGRERARLRDSRGLHYLRALLAAPGQEVPALDLAAGGAGLHAGDAGPVLDDEARAAYRRRLDELAEELQAADRAGDAGRAERAEAERRAVLTELKRATGLHGRTRTVSPEAERARVNVTRALRGVLDKILAVAPSAGAHLQGAIRTGNLCRYQPTAGGPSRWRL
jgi:tetratricopeptide (TPR) repeat protein